MKLLSILLLACPIALIARALGWSELVVFTTAVVGLIPLADLLGRATEELARHTGPRIGGLLNVTLGNAAELILTTFALQAGLFQFVKASIIGSILGNLLSVLGLSLLLGGLRHGTQYFDRQHAANAATLMTLSVVALGLPALFGHLVPVRNTGPVESLSEGVAVVMLTIYLLSLVYQVFQSAEGSARAAAVHEPPHWSRPLALGVLGSTTIGVAVLSEVLVGSIKPVVRSLDTTELFLGIVIIPIVGNVSEHAVAIKAAWTNRMDLSLVISLGSSMQVALLVAPLLVFLSLVLGQPMDLIFNPLELAALAAASGVAALVAHDGESNWLEGAMLLAVYLLLVLAFFWWPA